MGGALIGGYIARSEPNGRRSVNLLLGICAGCAVGQPGTTGFSIRVGQTVFDPSKVTGYRAMTMVPEGGIYEMGTGRAGSEARGAQAARHATTLLGPSNLTPPRRIKRGKWIMRSMHSLMSASASLTTNSLMRDRVIGVCAYGSTFVRSGSAVCAHYCAPVRVLVYRHTGNNTRWHSAGGKHRSAAAFQCYAISHPGRKHLSSYSPHIRRFGKISRSGRFPAVRREMERANRASTLPNRPGWNVACVLESKMRTQASSARPSR